MTKSAFSAWWRRLCSASASSALVAAGQLPRLRGLAKYSEGVSLAAAASIVIAFAILILAFIRSDFSVVNVYEHSHTDKPLLYKISGAWGSHEGSMLLWCTILLVYGAMITVRGGGLPEGLKHKALGGAGRARRGLCRLHPVQLQSARPPGRGRRYRGCRSIRRCRTRPWPSTRPCSIAAMSAFRWCSRSRSPP
ncbi:MAG: hypothetical protein WDN06_09215 [Asticcacaulis sp.]